MPVSQFARIAATSHHVAVAIYLFMFRPLGAASLRAVSLHSPEANIPMFTSFSPERTAVNMCLSLHKTTFTVMRPIGVIGLWQSLRAERLGEHIVGDHLAADEQAAAIEDHESRPLGKLNPDGSAVGSRQNADGVDLNRNFPLRWRAISDPIYNSGPRPRSEPETRIAMRLIGRLRPAVTVWYHQHEDLIDLAGADRGLARRYAELAGLRATCLPFLPGTASSWSNHTFRGTSSFCRRATRRSSLAASARPSSAGTTGARARGAKRLKARLQLAW